LVPFTFVAHGKRIRVSCGAHAFTKAQKPNHPPHLAFMDGKTARTFDAARYGYTTHLPAEIIAAANGAVYSNAGRYVFKGAIPGIKGVYIIAFDMRASNSPKYDVKIQIVSAHLTPKSKRMPKATFADAMGGLFNGTAVNWTKK
jgi:hypothetical protein